MAGGGGGERGRGGLRGIDANTLPHTPLGPPARPLCISATVARLKLGRPYNCSVEWAAAGNWSKSGVLPPPHLAAPIMHVTVTGSSAHVQQHQ